MFGIFLLNNRLWAQCVLGYRRHLNADNTNDEQAHDLLLSETCSLREGTVQIPNNSDMSTKLRLEPGQGTFACHIYRIQKGRLSRWAMYHKPNLQLYFSKWCKETTCLVSQKRSQWSARSKDLIIGAGDLLVAGTLDGSLPIRASRWEASSAELLLKMACPWTFLHTACLFLW